MLTSVSETDETNDSISSSKIIPPEHIESNKEKAHFDLLPNEEEEKLLGNSHKLPFISEIKRVDGKHNKTQPGHACTSPSLRSVSLPKGPLAQRACTSPQLQHATSVGNVNGTDNAPCTMPHGGTPTEIKKPKKLVSDYYKKQNELLENFKNDSEQIQVFQKSRTRQRLQSSTSTEADAGNCKEDENYNEKGDLSVPLLKHGDCDSGEYMGKPCRNTLTVPTTAANISTSRERKISDHSNDSMLAKHEAIMDKARATSKAASRLAHITLFVNISLMVAKAVASYLSGSLSIISSLVDSCVDITSGLVISVCTRLIKKRDPYLYPRGRTRLEPLSLIIISVVMGVASVQLIFDAIKRIATAYNFDVNGVNEQPTLNVSWITVGIMVATVAIKFTLFSICQKYKSDPSIKVLAQDHRNDCLSNTVALTCAWLAKRYWYYLDPIGAILVSVYILWTWVNTGREHLSKLSGKSAKPEFINRIIKVCIDHDPRISHLDTVYVYHYGTKFLVEVHIVLDENMPLKVAHDISESLQINIESLPEVERAFVHTDYEYEHQPQDEHKVV